MAYRGVVGRLPVGSQGFTGTSNPSQAGPGHLLYVDGAELDGGIIRKEGGADKLNASAIGTPSPVISGINWSPVPETHYDVVFLGNGSVLRDVGAGTFPTTLASGLSSVRDPPPHFMVAGGEGVGDARKLFMFSSMNQAQVVAGTGTSMAAISGPPADWSASFPTFGVLHNFRLFAGGNISDPHRIYYSDAADHEDFAAGTSGTLAVFPGEGERLVGGISFRGALVLWKYPLGVYVVNTSDPTIANWTVSRLTRAVGGVNQHCIIQIENEVLYLDRAGSVHALSATQEFGDVNTSDIGQIADIEPFIRSSINRTLIRRAQGLWYPGRRQAWFSLPTLGSDDNNIRLIIGFASLTEGQGAPPRFFMSRRDVAISLWTRPDAEDVEKPASGDADGFVWLMDLVAREKDGAGYPITFETANTDLAFIDPSLATRMKTGQFLELVSEPRGDWDLTVEVFWDDILTDTILFNMGGTGAALGSFILDTDILASDVVTSDRQRITGSGRRLKLAATNAGQGQDVSLAEFHLSFAVMDERIRE